MGSDYLDRCTGLAVMGGTFDPIHNGHLAIAEAVLHQFKPQKVLFIPAGKPPHKPDKPVSNPGLRYRMITLAICTLPGIDASLMELERIGPSYTVDTIRDLRESCPSECKIYFIVGQDALENILTWKDAETLLTLCEFIAVPRPGYDKKTLKSLIGKLEKKYGAIIHILKCPMLDISSTYIRECFA
ncbi:MAG: nicotinate-nucleotide adenylyltransferase, partial [Firmicutes bacterium]|nr:nicotinate-nucleotide adenylyltransferase [Bacillota bacterium]